MKIGTVPYLNALPLIWDFIGKDEYSITSEIPSKLISGLFDDRYDVVLAPVVELLRSDVIEICSDACISSTGLVKSVLVVSPKSLKNAETIYLDESSKTSVELLKIIWKSKFNKLPKFEYFCPESLNDVLSKDATLIIGDNALRLDTSQYNVIDLGSEWSNLTELPMVYAVWFAKKGIGLNLKPILDNARNIGIKKLEVIAEYFSRDNNFSSEFCLSYLTENIKYNLGEKAIKGMELFLNKINKSSQRIS